MLFDRAFVTNSICAPSRAVILTGKHSHLNGQLTNGQRFDGEQQTFPKLLQKKGYQTAMVGKWHLKSDPTGFDFWQVLQGQGPYYNPPMNTPDGVKKITGYTTDVITDVSLDWLKNKRDPNKPFILMSHTKHLTEIGNRDPNILPNTTMLIFLNRKPSGMIIKTDWNQLPHRQ